MTSQVSPHGTPLVAMQPPPRYEDNDVAAERARIEQTPNEVLFEQESLVLRGLTKLYGGFQAVDSLSIGIRKGAYTCLGRSNSP